MSGDVPGADRTKAEERPKRPREGKPQGPPEVYQVVIECRDEGQQRELFERMKAEGRRVRLMVL